MCEETAYNYQNQDNTCKFTNTD